MIDDKVVLEFKKRLIYKKALAILIITLQKSELGSLNRILIYKTTRHLADEY